MHSLRLLTITLTVFISFLSFSNQGFEKNDGQFMHPSGEINQDVLFCFEKNGFKVTLRKDGFSYEVVSFLSDEISKKIEEVKVNSKFDIHHERIDFIFPKKPDQIVTHDRLKTKHRYYKASKMIESQLFKRIVYHNVQEGIDVEFLISDGNFKYNIIKNKGADLSEFFLEVMTDGEVIFDEKKIEFNLKHTSIVETIPYSFLYQTNEEKIVDYSFEDGKMRFVAHGVENDTKLIVDPEPDLVWSTFFGGNQYDFLTDSSIGEGDTLYTVGITMSSNNIATSGAYQTTYQGDLDVSISKFEKNGDLIWSTYYAGPQSERSYAISIDENNELYVSGSTFSNIGFVTGGAHQTNIDGADDIFIVKMSSSGVREWGTYHGGNAHDFVTDMHVKNDSIYLVGHTTSTNNMSSSGAHQENNVANEAGHITLFNTNGDFLWGTYIGNDQNNSTEGLAVTENRIIIAGRSSGSTGISTTGSFQENMAGFTNGFLSSFSKTGTQLWGTYYGGQYTDVATDVALDTNGGIFIVGNASSQNNISTPGAHQETRLSSEQGFIAHFDGAGNRIWGTYTGGTGSDYVNVIDSDSLGSIYIGGKTTSIEDIPTQNAYQSSLSGSFDGFIQRFNFDGTLEWGTYLGGIGSEDITSLELNRSNNLITTGSTNQNDTIFGVGNSNNDQYNGGSLDGFIAYLCQENSPLISFENGQLVSTPADSYEWYLDGQTINLYNQSINPPSDGIYAVETSSFGKCPVMSDTFYYSSNSIVIDDINEFNIYPNPTKSKIYIDLKTKSRITVTDLTGRVLFDVQGVKKSTVDLSSFNSGLYLVTINNDEDTFKKSIIKID